MSYERAAVGGLAKGYAGQQGLSSSFDTSTLSSMNSGEPSRKSNPLFKEVDEELRKLKTQFDFLRPENEEAWRLGNLNSNAEKPTTEAKPLAASVTGLSFAQRANQSFTGLGMDKPSSSCTFGNPNKPRLFKPTTPHQYRLRENSISAKSNRTETSAELSLVSQREDALHFRELELQQREKQLLEREQELGRRHQEQERRHQELDHVRSKEAELERKERELADRDRKDKEVKEKELQFRKK